MASYQPYHTIYENEVKDLFDKAKFRAVYHSSAADFNQTGHLAVNGITIRTEENQDMPDSCKSYSRYASAGRQREWIYADLGSIEEIEKAVVLWDTKNYAKKYQLEQSADAVEWIPFAYMDSGAGSEELIPFEALRTRYVRLSMEECAGERYEILSLSLYGRKLPEKEADITIPVRQGNLQKLPLTWKLNRASETGDSPDQSENGCRLSSAYEDTDWFPAVVPGTVLTAFRKNGSVPDDTYSDWQRQISDSYFTADFWYRNTFLVEEPEPNERIFLQFDAVNWKAEVYLNGSPIGTIEGAFIRSCFDITKHVLFHAPNHLAVLIRKNKNPGAVYEKTLQETGPNGGILGADNPTIHPSVGWDWVPVIRGRNTGIYGDVYLRFVKDILILDPYITTKQVHLHDAALECRMGIRNLSGRRAAVRIKGCIEPGQIPFEAAETLEAYETKEIIISGISIRNAKLWQPNGYGEQFLYQAVIGAGIEGEDISFQKSFAFGIREITYTEGNPLAISVNGTRIFCRGGNWGMDDSHLEAGAEEYDIKVRLHAEENFTMIRNWVGQTNQEAFYDACDRYGILVWDDFWLANPSDGPDPDNEEMFLKNARDKIKRVRSHACLALYCGRNEGNPPETLDDALRRLVAELDPKRWYIPHSASDTVSGFGPYSVKHPKFYFENAPITLHSERGMPNIPTMESIQRMLPKEARWPINTVWGLHDFTLKSAQRLETFLEAMKQYGEFDTLEEFSKYAQMVNYENHKAMFEGVAAAESNGMLMWMSQSAWPSFVWQTYDYYYDTNAGYFGIKTANQPVHPIWHPVTGEVLITNHTPNDLHSLSVETEVFDIHGTLLQKTADTADVLSAAAAVCRKITLCGSEMVFLRFKVYQSDGRKLGENFYWTNPEEYQNYKALGSMGQAEATGTAHALPGGTRADGTGVMKRYQITVKNSSRIPALLVRLMTLHPETAEQILPVYYADNYFPLMPLEEKTITLEYDGQRAGEMEPVFSVEGFNVGKKTIVMHSL